VDFEIPESGADGQHASVPPSFSHMAIEAAEDVPRIRVRLTAVLAPDGVIDERIEYILESDESGEPVKRADMSRYDRAHIEVHYLPARRDPAEHIAYTSAWQCGRSFAERVSGGRGHRRRRRPRRADHRGLPAPPPPVLRPSFRSSPSVMSGSGQTWSVGMIQSSPMEV
jgi:hypothetical protein